MRIIAVSTLRAFWARRGRHDAEQPLRTWVHIVKAAQWSNPAEVKGVFRSADILPNERVVFNIGGNKYRLIVAIHYRAKCVFVRFIGTHTEYDKIDACEDCAMEIRPIRSNADYRSALKEIERLWDAELGTAVADHVEVLSTLVEAYETKYHPIRAPDPIAAIEFMMEQKGLTRRDLEPAIGSRGRVSEILNRKRPLTLPMVRALSALLEIPAEVLVQPYETQSAA